MANRIECAFDATISRDAEVKTASNGRSFIAFSVTVSDGKEEQWLSVSAWSDHLKDLAPSLVKGVEVYVTGRLRMRHWETPQGSRSSLQVSADGITPKWLIGAKKPKAPRGGKKAKADPQRPLEGADGRPFDDSLPF